MRHTLQAIAEVAGLIFQRGWAERNAGNISVDVTEECISSPGHSRGIVVETQALDPLLAGRSYLVTATGARFREVAREPEEHVVLVRVADDLSGYRVLLASGREDGALTTSEFPSHLAIHAYLRRNHPDKKAVLHTHPDHLLALTHVPQYLSTDSLTRVLWAMHPEMKIVMPDGVGLVPYRLPGSDELAAATVDVLQKHRLVLWEKHGCVAVGRDVFEAFDLVDTAEKSARVFFLAKSAGFEPEGLSDEQLGDLRPLK